MPESGKRARGFTLAELLVVVAVVGLLTGVAARVVRRSMIKTQINAVVAESKQIYKGVTEFYIDASRYPTKGDSFDKLGYYEGTLGKRNLVDTVNYTYETPDDSREFWLLMTLTGDPDVQFLVANSDDTPYGEGVWYDGVFLFRDGELMRLGQFDY